MNTKEKNNIPTDAYITVKREEGKVEIYVGGKPATTYHGEDIRNIPFIKEVFAKLQKRNPDVEEFHIGAFETPGEFARYGNPSSGFGLNAWCRVKFKNGEYGSWVFSDKSIFAADSARGCANICATDVYYNEDFCDVVCQNDDMPKDAYITVRRNVDGEVEIYVGCKPATTYHGQDILNIPHIKEVFAELQKRNPDIKEFHIGAFETPGKFARYGNPSSGFGPHAWYRVQFKNGEYGYWVFHHTYWSAADCAYRCAIICANCFANYFADYVRNDADFYAAVFNAPDDTSMLTYTYITVKRNEQGKVDIYVGGKPATTYHGQPICGIELIKKYFEWMQGKYPDIEEFHIGAFATRGAGKGQTGNPSSVFGPNAWCRVKRKNGTSSWVFHDTDGSKTLCAGNCAVDCAADVRYGTGFHDAVFQNNVPTDAYITVKCNEKGEVEIYVGGKPATTYHGQPICGIKLIKKYFAWMQGKYPDIEEFHIGAFSTRGDKMGQTGNPSSGFGPHAWCRVKRKNGTSSWVFYATDGSETLCAGNCAVDCAYSVRYDTDYCTAVLNVPIVPQGDVLAQLKQKVNEVSNLLQSKRAQQRTK